MIKIELTAEAEATIRAHACFEFTQTAERLPNGNYLIPFQPKTIARLKEHMFPGEGYSDTILRLFAAHDGRIN